MSSAALLSAGASDAIPREHHRRLLKKIAQLTKVIYALNTKTEDHEAFVEALRLQYDKKWETAEVASANRTREMEERVRIACESTEGRLREMKKRQGEERERLQQTHVCYKREVEGRMEAVRMEWKEKVEGLVREVEGLRKEQGDQLQEVEKMRERVKRKLEEREKELEAAHREEMEITEKRWRDEIDLRDKETAAVKTAMEREVSKLKKRHEAEVDSVRVSLQEDQEKAVADERWCWEEKVAKLQEEMREKGDFAKKVSSLSSDLRASQDCAAVSQQMVGELERKLEMREKELNSLRKQLEEAGGTRKQKELEIQSLKSSMMAASEETEQWKERAAEKEALINTLEVEHKNKLRELHVELQSLRERLREAESERDSLATHQKSSTEHHSDKMRALEKEIGRLQQERQALHSQYACEIEAAHAQLGTKQIEKDHQHTAILDALKQEHARALQELQENHNLSLGQLRDNLLSAAELEKSSLNQQHNEKVEDLETALNEAEAGYKRTKTELSEVLKKLEEEGKRQKELVGEVGSLRRTVEMLREQERTFREEANSVREEVDRLKLEMEEEQKKKVTDAEQHMQQLSGMRKDLQEKTEQQWQAKMRAAMDGLRRELEEAHSHSLRDTMVNLSEVRERALDKARHAWNEEREKLREKVRLLEQQLLDLQELNSLSIKERRREADERITKLRDTVEKERQSHADELERLKHYNEENLERVEREMEESRREEVEGVRIKYQEELEAREEAHCVAVRVLREKGEREMMEAARRAEDKHQQETFSLRATLSQLHQEELERMKLDWAKEREGWSREKVHLDSEKEKEVSGWQSRLQDALAGLERREQELCVARDSTNCKNVELGQLRKMLEVRGHELDTARREAGNILRCREQELNSAHQAELSTLSSQHSQDTQLLLTDFNRAKKIMNQKTAQLLRQLSDMESQYRCRESRPEDLQAIQELRRVTHEQEARMKEMATEKRIYQLELANREKNYNQLFSVSPHVGVLDPLSHKKKPRSDAPSTAVRHSSAPSLVSSTHTKLPPLVDSHTTETRLTASDIELTRQIKGGGRINRTQPFSESPLTRRRLKDKCTEH